MTITIVFCLILVAGIVWMVILGLRGVSHGKTS